MNVNVDCVWPYMTTDRPVVSSVFYIPPPMIVK